MTVKVVLRIVGQPSVKVADISVTPALTNVVYDLWDILHRTHTPGCVEVWCDTTVYRFWADVPYDFEINQAVEDHIWGRGKHDAHVSGSE